MKRKLNLTRYYFSFILSKVHIKCLKVCYFSSNSMSTADCLAKKTHLKIFERKFLLEKSFFPQILKHDLTQFFVVFHKNLTFTFISEIISLIRI